MKKEIEEQSEQIKKMILITGNTAKNTQRLGIVEAKCQDVLDNITIVM
jgi:hypothetical protein